MQRGAGGAARYWAGVEVRRRWKSLVAVGLLAGITAGLAAATFVGARQTDTALEKLRREARAPDAIVFASQVGVDHPDWSRLRAAPEVERLAVWDLVDGSADGEPGVTLFASHDGAFGDEVTRPVITDGRMWDPAASDEVIVTPVLAAEAPVGTTVNFQPYGADQDEGASTPAGPVVELHVVGVGTTVNRFLFAPDQAFISPGFTAKYGDQVRLSENADVVLRGGATDIPALQRDLDAALAPGTPLLDLHNAARRVETTLAVERTALYLLTAAIALAGGLLVAQTLARSSGSIADDRPALRSMGMSSGSVRAAALYTHLLPAAVAAIGTVAVAVVVSQWLPVGLARQIYPDVGLHVDMPVLLVAAFVVAAVVLAGSAWSVRGGLRVGTRGHSGSRVAAVVRRQSPLTIGLGTTMAFDRGVDRGRVAVRPALVGAVVGVLGVTAAFTVTAGVDHALAHPEQAGVTWQATIDPSLDQYGETALDPDLLNRVIEAVPAGSGVSEGDRTPMAVNGVGVPAFTLRPAADPEPALAVLSGRSPAAAGEAVIGPKTASDLHVDTGDVVTVGDAQRAVTIVGKGLFPSDVHAEFDEGLWLVPEDFDAVVGPVDRDHLFDGPNRAVIVTFPAGTKATDAIEHTQEQLGDSVAFVSAPEVPLELSNLHNVRVLPLALAAFLALLAVGALSYVLVASSRRRRREFGILRAIGLDRRSIRRVVHVQATAIAIVGLVFGIVLGIVLGRAAWRLIAGEVPLQLVLPNAWLAVLLIIPIALVVVNALALWPAHRAARGRPAEALRAE